MPADRTLSFVALVTIGVGPQDDRVLEVAAVRRGGTEELDRFSQLANPGPLPLAVQKLTGLDAARLARQPSPEEALAKLLAFVGEDAAAVHGADEFGSVLAAAGLPAPAGLLDSLALARIALPSARDFSLQAIGRALALRDAEGHTALELAVLTAQVWQRLWEEVRGLPAPVLDALQRVARSADNPLAEHLTQAANQKAGFKLSAEPTAALGAMFSEHRDLFARAQKYEAPQPGNEPLDTEKICAMFTPGGAVGRNLAGYEQRPEQMEMVGLVCESLNAARHLMLEAGTGTGKSMAYLVPAIAWACQNQDKIIVSTNTKNLQEQLYHKDLPFLRELFSGRFEAALLKGRRNYLCVRRLLHLMRHYEQELAGPGETEALLPLLAWAGRTETGDLAECTALLLERLPSHRAGDALVLLERITSSGDECAGRACPVRGRCFVRRARALAQLADLVVVNHALLFAEVGLDQPYLPLERCLILDEAHNVEDVATQALAVKADALSVFRVTNRLWRQRRDGSGSGMVSTVMYQANRHLPATGPMGKETAIHLAQGVIESIGDVVELTRECFETLAGPFEAVPSREVQILLRECRPAVGLDSPTGKAAEALAKCVTRLCGRIQDLSECLEGNAERLSGAQDVVSDLRAQAGALKEAMDALQFVLAQEKEDYVYWLERTRRERQSFYSLHAAPLEIGRFIRGCFFDELRCVTMTSATLRVSGGFSYMRERLGADELDEERMICAGVGSSFDYDRQALVCVPTFLPDAGGQRDLTYDEELSSFLIDLLTATGGRALVLFTSYSLLDNVYERIKGPLEREGTPVLAQGHDGNRATLTTLFREVTGSILLGTQSFWEGVDVAGEALSCLVLTKLPFHVFTEPLVQGRIEYLRAQGKDPFRHYTLPEAVISFRQGFGRLIRHRTDRGVVVVTDRRLATMHYGRNFLRDLPTRHRVFKAKAPLLRAVRQFFERPF